MTLRSSEGKPSCGLVIVQLQPFALEIEESELVLGLGVALFGCRLVPSGCLYGIDIDPDTVPVHLAEEVLRSRVADFGARAPLLKRNDGVLGLGRRRKHLLRGLGRL